MKIRKKRIYDKGSRVKMMEGIDEAADVIGSTMSAKGRNVIVDKEYGAPLVINDGVTILNELFFVDQVKNAGVQLLKEAAVRTNVLAGDGTTATTVLARAIIKKGWEMVGDGANPVLLRKSIEKAAEKIEKNLVELADKVDTAERAVEIASVSVQDEELGKKIGELMFDVGANGAVTIKDALQRGVFIEKDGGMRLEGALTAGMADNPHRFETKMTKPHILILKDSPEDNEFETKWIPFMRQLADARTNPKGGVEVTKVNVPNLLIVAEKLSRRFIMGMNANKEIIKWVWFRPTTADKNMKEIYKDLKSMIGGDIVDEEDGVHLMKYNISQMGKAESAVISRHELILTVSEEQSQRSEYLDRINIVQGQIESADDEVEQRQIKDRYANLTGGVATIRAMAATDQDTVEMKLRIEDAINATRAAMEEGYVAGGGVALYNAATDNQTDGEKVLYDACKSSLRQIFYNAGYEDSEDKIKNLKPGFGANVLTDETVDMKQEGIVDPLKVIRLSLIHAVSVAGLLLTSEYLIIDEGDDDVTKLREIFNPQE